MLRYSRRILTIPLLCKIILYTALLRTASAQEEETIAPWKISELDQLDWSDLNEADSPEQKPANRDSASSSHYFFIFSSRFQYAYPYADEVTVSPYRQGMRGTLTRSGRMHLGVALEKDAGENQFLDHTMIAAAMELLRPKLRITLGDYRVQYGAGMVIRTARNYGLPFSADATLFSNREGVRIYNGWEENLALRGGAVEGGYRAMDFSVWGSRSSRDAQLDSSGNITSFSNSGLHRTDSEKSRQDACLEDVVGAQAGLALLNGNFRLGAVAYGVRWNHPVLTSGSTVSDALAGGIHLKLKHKFLSITSEAAFDRESHAAWIGAVRIVTVDLQSNFAAYYVDPRYFSPLSASLDFDYGKAANRQGVFAGLVFPKLFLHPSGFCHIYAFPQVSPNVSRGGQDVQLRIRQTILQPVVCTASTRWVQENEAETGLRTSRWSGSATIEIQPSAATKVQSELRLSRAQEANATGKMLRLKIELTRRFFKQVTWQGNVSTGMYDSGSPLVKLYWYNADGSGNFFLRQLQGRGGIRQLEMTVYVPSFGKLGWTFYWDEPAGSEERDSYYSIYANYRFP